MIAEYEAEGRDPALNSPRIYGLNLNHKHLPEMKAVCGLSLAPVFCPVVDDYYKGMATTVALPAGLTGGLGAERLREELAADEPSVIIVRRPCVLLKQVKTAAPLAVDPAKCVGCKACMKLGCPSISIRAGKAHVDETLCVGCGVCKELCRMDAFTGKTMMD